MHEWGQAWHFTFQSLGRDSGCSSQPEQQGAGATRQFQSLGRDSGCSSLGVASLADIQQRFQSLGRDSGCSSKPPARSVSAEAWFQSLGRDSGCSSANADTIHRPRRKVSIPRSGFWVFKLSWARWRADCGGVSIPRSGFWVFKPAPSPA